jgi:hypothetical protein
VTLQEQAPLLAVDTRAGKDSNSAAGDSNLG